jgi:predicted 2-oxoglutarate/Fe(II)-dependent dioxygenase YbiX
MEIVNINKDIKMFKNIISQEEADLILDTAKSMSEEDWLVYRKTQRHEKDEWLDQILETSKIDKIDRSIFTNISNKIINIISKEYNDKEYRFNDMDHLYRFQEGDSMKVHHDVGMDPTVKFGAVLYLNDDFDGGEIYYPKMNIEVKPTNLSLIVHPANAIYSHGVKEVTRGIRYSLTTFLRLPLKD